MRGAVRGACDHGVRIGLDVIDQLLPGVVGGVGLGDDDGAGGDRQADHRGDDGVVVGVGEVVRPGAVVVRGHLAAAGIHQNAAVLGGVVELFTELGTAAGTVVLDDDVEAGLLLQIVLHDAGGQIQGRADVGGHEDGHVAGGPLDLSGGCRGVGLGRVGLRRIGLRSVGLGCVGLRSVRLGRFGLGAAAHKGKHENGGKQECDECFHGFLLRFCDSYPI